MESDSRIPGRENAGASEAEGNPQRRNFITTRQGMFRNHPLDQCLTGCLSQMRVPPDEFIKQTPPYKVLLEEASRLQHHAEELTNELEKKKAQADKVQTDHQKEKDDQEVRCQAIRCASSHTEFPVSFI